MRTGSELLRFSNPPRMWNSIDDPSPAGVSILLVQFCANNRYRMLTKARARERERRRETYIDIIHIQKYSDTRMYARFLHFRSRVQCLFGLTCYLEALPVTSAFSDCPVFCKHVLYKSVTLV